MLRRFIALAVLALSPQAYAADPAQADSARVTSQSEAIAGLYLAIDKDDVREFDRWDPIVLGY